MWICISLIIDYSIINITLISDSHFLLNISMIHFYSNPRSKQVNLLKYTESAQ